MSTEDTEFLINVLQANTPENVAAVENITGSANPDRMEGVYLPAQHMNQRRVVGTGAAGSSLQGNVEAANNETDTRCRPRSDFGVVLRFLSNNERTTRRKPKLVSRAERAHGQQMRQRRDTGTGVAGSSFQGNEAANNETAATRRSRADFEAEDRNMAIENDIQQITRDMEAMGLASRKERFEAYYRLRIEELADCNLLHENSAYNDCFQWIQHEPESGGLELGRRAIEIFKEMTNEMKSAAANKNIQAGIQDLGIDATRVALIFKPFLRKVLVTLTGEGCGLPKILVHADGSIQIEGADGADFVKKYCPRSCHQAKFGTRTYLVHGIHSSFIGNHLSTPFSHRRNCPRQN